jgi:trigger factor
MFDAEAENFLRDYDMRLRQSGLDLNTYIKYTGMTLDGLRDQFRPQAERQVKARLALEKIAELENLVPSEEEINAEYQRIADAYNMPVDQVKESIPADAITDDMRVKKAMDLVREKAVITDEAPAAEQPAAKKPAAKKTTTTRKTTGTTTKKTTAKKTEGEGEAAPAAKKTTAKKPAAKKATDDQAE